MKKDTVEGLTLSDCERDNQATVSEKAKKREPESRGRPTVPGRASDRGSKAIRGGKNVFFTEPHVPRGKKSGLRSHHTPE